MNQDGITNACGCLNIMSLPVPDYSRVGHNNIYGKDKIKVLEEYFGNPFYVLRSFPDRESKNGYMEKPVLQDVVLKKEQLFQEFCVARADLYQT